MKMFELVLLITGSILFLFSLLVILLFIKKDKPYIKAIWLLVISFLMMGFSSIAEAEFFGLFKYEKEKKLTELEVLAKALEYCPDNTDIKTVLNDKLHEFEDTEKATKTEEQLILGDVYLSVGDESKAIAYSNEALSKDSANTKAKNIKKIANTQSLIKKLPISEKKEAVRLQVESNIEELKSNPAINKNKINQMQRIYQYKVDSLLLKAN
jgi:tetratricopeptide (TPR) repeat protein